jgi:hypothetical protein
MKSLGLAGARVRRIVRFKTCDEGGPIVSKSVLEAIREGNWDFEPMEADRSAFDATQAIPGTREKLKVLAERVRSGLPLWHERDRADYEELAARD